MKASHGIRVVGATRLSPRDRFMPPRPVLGLLVLLLGLTVLLWGIEERRGAFAISPALPSLVVVARPQREPVTFEAYTNVGRIWPRRGDPWAISTLEVTVRRDQTGSVALWQIEAPSPRPGPIAYGQLPAGFVQMVPGAGAPPSLLPGESYVVAVRGSGRSGRAHFSVQTSN